MSRFRRIVIIIALFGLSADLFAIVYTLQKGYGLKDIRDMVKATHVLKDSVTVNGNQGSIDVYLSPLDFSDILTTLSPVIKNDLQFFGKGTLVIDVPGRDWTNRMLILNAGTKNKVVVFQLRLPKTRAGAPAAASWPSEIPKPVGVTVDSVMKLKKSQSTFCQFSDDSGSDFLFGYDQALTGQGWNPLSRDNSAGGVYMSKDSNKMLILSAWNDDKRAYGSVYLSPLKN